MEGHLKCVAFNAAGSLVATAGPDRQVYIIELNTGEMVKLAGHTETVYSICFSSDGQILASGSESSRLWNLEQRKEIGNLPLESHVAYSLAFRPDGELLAVERVQHNFPLAPPDTGGTDHVYAAFEF